MSNSGSKTLTISVMQKEFQVACPEGEEAALLRAAWCLSEQVEAIEAPRERASRVEVARLEGHRARHAQVDGARRHATTSNGNQQRATTRTKEQQ